MMNARPWLVRTLLVATACFTLPALGQIKELRKGDDQFIQGLREQGMAELLEHFSESDPPEDPIAKLALDVSLKEFIASDLLARATQASQAQDFAQANQLFLESRETFDGLLAAQRQLIADHPDDERMPIWQTDFAEMIIDRYLPRYYQNAMWHYEFGQPSAEQKQAYEALMIEALQVTSDATTRLELLPGRVSRTEGLRRQIEELQIWFKLQDYTSINTPYWYAHAAHGVSLLPDDHDYFAAGNMVRAQRAGAQAEKDRLRGRVFDACTDGALARDERTKLTANMLAGRTLVRSSDIDDIDDGVDLLETEVIAKSPGTYHGYLATLGKAYGRFSGGEPDIAETILNGMDRHQYVQNDATVVSRLLAADLLFRLLEGAAQGQSAKIAEAYEKAYIPLIDGPDDRFKQVLFTRWAAEVGDDVDPLALPATVRMGIGEQLTSQGGGMAQAAVALSMQPAPAIPAEAERWRNQIKQQVEEAKTIIDRAVVFNTTLVGDENEAGPVLARGLYNLGTNQYWLAELKKALLEDKNQIGWQPYFAVCKTWLEMAVRVPEAEQAEQAISFAINLLLPMDDAINKQSIVEPELRAVYKQAFEQINDRWPQSQAAQDNRLYAGFFLYEKAGDLEKAAEVYGALPNTHRDYFQAKRQMVYALHRSYRSQSDKLRLMVATKPLDTPPSGLSAEQIEEYNSNKDLWQQQHDALQEDIRRKRDLIIDEAEIVIIDAEDEVEGGKTPAQRFAAATALGACRVVLAGMEADSGSADTAMELLEGFETQYSPAGEYKDLAALQASPDAAAATLNGLVQSAQEQRILTLLDAKRTNEMAEQAKVMMEQSPDVAAAVISGVQQRIGAEIDREKRAIEAAAFKVIKEEAQKNIAFYAKAAVDLGELLVQWAEGQGFDEKQMVAYKLPLAESLMLADQGEEAVKIMTPILEIYPNNFKILISHGRAHLAVFRKTKKEVDYNAAMSSLGTVVKYYNQRPEKPAPYWEAWLSIMELMDAAGGEPAKTIPERARILYGVDENLGGPAFKERFEVIFRRNGGVERLNPRPS